jgi:hypothetical protein
MRPALGNEAVKKGNAAMTKKQGALFSCLAGIFVLYGCASYPVSPGAQSNEGAMENIRSSESGPPERRLIRSEPEPPPIWKDILPKTGEELFFVGVSRIFGSAADARNDARENAFIQVMRFYGEFIRSGAVEKSYFSGSSAETIAVLVDREEEISNFAQAVVSQIGTDKYYTEIYLNGRNQEEYIVYALCQIPRQKAEQDIADFAKNTSERYGNLLAKQATLHSTLRLYEDTLKALEQNPLHRAVAYYDGPGGRVNLYEYLSLQINTLAGGVYFDPLSSVLVQKTDTLETAVTVYSPFIAAAGALNCMVAIYGGNNLSPTVTYTADADNSFLLRIFTSRLEPGRYTVSLELLLNEISPRIQKNPTAGFSFEVTPIAAAVEFEGGDLPEEAKSAFIRGLQRGLQNSAVPVRLGQSPGETQNRYAFIITVQTRIQPPSPPVNIALLLCDADIAFALNGTIVRQSERKRITEAASDTARAFSLAADYVRDNRAFFQGVAEALTR